MHERMNPITELVRTATRIQIETPSILLEKPEKKEAIEYLKNDDEINITIYKSTVINEDHAIIDITMKENERIHLCADCKHMVLKGERLDNKMFCKVKKEFKEYMVESCEEYIKWEYQ